MSTPTELELVVIRGIARNDFMYGELPIDKDVWSDCLDCTSEPGMPKGKRLSGVMSSLCQKGFAQSDGVRVRLLEPARPYLP